MSYEYKPIKKITGKQLKNFNLKKKVSGNEEYNKAHDLPSIEQGILLMNVASSLFGCGPGRNITPKDIKEFVIYYIRADSFLARICEDYKQLMGW